MANRCFALLFDLDPDLLKQDLQTCLSFSWMAHFNKRDYEGNWTVLSLRSASGDIHDISSHPEVPFVNTPLLDRCRYIHDVLERLNCPNEAVRLLRLAPGSRILTHRDVGAGYQHGFFRLHIPLQLPKGVSFIVDGAEVPMRAFECWYADFDRPHSVTHNGNEDRIHLVIDCIRNEWSDEWFAKAGYDFTAEKGKHDAETVQRMIAELEIMNTETSRKMIADLKRQQHA